MCAKIGSRVWVVAPLRNKKEEQAKKSHRTHMCCPHVASGPLIGPEPTLAGLVNSLTLSLTPNFKSIEIQLCLWRRVEVSCLSITTADAINTAIRPPGCLWYLHLRTLITQFNSIDVCPIVQLFCFHLTIKLNTCFGQCVLYGFPGGLTFQVLMM